MTDAKDAGIQQLAGKYPRQRLDLQIRLLAALLESPHGIASLNDLGEPADLDFRGAGSGGAWRGAAINALATEGLIESIPGTAASKRKSSHAGSLRTWRLADRRAATLALRRKRLALASYEKGPTSPGLHQDADPTNERVHATNHE